MATNNKIISVTTVILNFFLFIEHPLPNSFQFIVHNLDVISEFIITVFLKNYSNEVTLHRLQLVFLVKSCKFSTKNKCTITLLE